MNKPRVFKSLEEAMQAGTRKKASEAATAFKESIKRKIDLDKAIPFKYRFEAMVTRSCNYNTAAQARPTDS